MDAVEGRASIVENSTSSGPYRDALMRPAHAPRRRFQAAVLVGTAIVVLGGCHSNGDGGLVEQSSRPPTPAELATRHVATFEAGLGTLLNAQVEELAALDRSALLAASGALGEAGHPYRDLLQSIYSERDFRPVFTTEAGLSPPGQTVLDVLADSWAHALEPEHYGTDNVAELLQSHETARVLLASPPPTRLAHDDRDALIEALAAQPDLLELDAAELQNRLSEWVLAPESSPAPQLQALAADRVAAVRVLSGALVDVELALAEGVLRYSWDMRFSNPHWFEVEESDDDTTAAIATPEAERVEVAQQRAMASLFRAGVEAGFGPALSALPPPYEQYPRLVEAHRRYREIALNGGWRTDLAEVELRLGRDHEMVPRLRERLAAEGYFEGDVTSMTFDRPLRSAIEAYQRTHQYRDNGRINDHVANSLNTPALRRAQQIALTLRRWRESQITDDDYFVFVNIPDFHGEVWRNGDRDMRFRIIVGSTQRFRSRDSGEVVFPRATPEIHEDLRFLVFNPYWNVPPGIMINEYDPNLEENPMWYEENGFEVLYNERGRRWVRQLPGPDNALGEVKFLFPNEHDVYMHDTPLRGLFRRTNRTFSHGCMRVQDPLALAEYLLQNDRGWDRQRIDRERAGGAEQWITLRTPLAVHVEYYVVRVGDEGHVHFLSDIYFRDRPRVEAIVRHETSQAVGSAVDQVQAGVASALSLTLQAPDPIESAAAAESVDEASDRVAID